MSSDVEQRLDGLLDHVPEPGPEVGERARFAAIAALRPAAPSHRGLRTGVLAFAAAVVLLAVAAGSLAAAGALHVRFGTPKPARAAALRLPSGAAGVAAVVDGRLSVLTRSGFRLQGLPVSSAALSPHALFVAAGIGRSLVAMSPNGRRAWSRPVGGTVIAISWAPFGTRIAYIVRSGRRLGLHMIWGNGRHDSVVDPSVRGVRPEWRVNSLAFAYLGAGGRPIVYDIAHESHRAAPGLHLQVTEPRLQVVR
jgi:hypothetical protein